MLDAAARLRPSCERHGVPADAEQPPGAGRRRPGPTACTSTGPRSTSPRPARRSARRSCSAARPHSGRRSTPRSSCRSTTSASAPCTRRRSGPTATAVGHALITYASRNSRLPFFAVGGIEPHNTGAVAAAGAQRIAVVRAITEAERSRSARPPVLQCRDRLRPPTSSSATAPAPRRRTRPRARSSSHSPRASAPGRCRLAVALAALAALINLVAYAAGAKLHGSKLSHLGAGAVRDGDAGCWPSACGGARPQRCCCSWRCWRSSSCCSRCS